jgi:DNA-binding NarL/FixJ family response regulator
MKSKLSRKAKELTGRKERSHFWDERRTTKKLREVIIKKLMAQGASNVEIAEATGVSVKTIQRRRKGL